MEEYKKEMLMVSAILFKNNVPVEEAKPIGVFIEKLIKENQQLKEKLEANEKARKESLELLEKSYDFIDEDYNKDLIDIYELINKLSLDIDKGAKNNERRTII